MQGTFKGHGTPVSRSLIEAVELPGLWLLEIALLNELPDLVEKEPQLADQVWKTIAMIQNIWNGRKTPDFSGIDTFL